jgi:hypothetical protein
MLAQIKKMSLDKNRRNPHYRVLLQCPDGSELFIHFNYTYRSKTYWSRDVYYNNVHKKSQLAWYTQSVEEMTAQQFLEELGAKVNEHFNFTLRR